MGKTDLGDGYTRWDYRVHYPINSYNVSLNIAEYAHFCETHRRSDAGLLRAAGEPREGEAAVRAGEADDRGVREVLRQVSVPEGRLQADRSAVLRHGAPERRHLRQPLRERLPRTRLDRRRHQPQVRLHHHSRERRTSGSATPSRPPTCPTCGSRKAGATTWSASTSKRCSAATMPSSTPNGYKSKVGNKEPIITQRGIHRTPNQDMYFKGALFLDTLRNAVNDDARVVEAGSRHLREVQVPEHHDRGPGPLLQRRAEAGHDADLRSVPAPRRSAGARADVRRGRRSGVVPLEGRRARRSRCRSGSAIRRSGR